VWTFPAEEIEDEVNQGAILRAFSALGIFCDRRPFDGPPADGRAAKTIEVDGKTALLHRDKTGGIMNNKGFTITALAILTLLHVLRPSDAQAMHITEGLLPMSWAVWWFVVAAPFVVYGLFRLKKMSAIDLSFKPLLGLMAAIVFVFSCMPIPVPTAGTCSHPCGTGLSAILLGPGISVLVATVALLLQALFLAHGGLSTLGANIVSMGVMGSFAGYLMFKALRGFEVNLGVSGFVAGLLADWATYLATSVELASGIKGDSPFTPIFWKILIAFIPTQLPLGILEGALTGGMLVFLYKRRPDLLVKMGVIKQAGGDKSTRGITGAALIVLSLVLCCSPLTAASATEKWQGVDESVVERVAKEHGREAQRPLINTDQGDLLLFVFLLAGAAGGFAGGYYWRSLMDRGSESHDGRGEIE
jgi:cobalt/nickel transport system permease protein